MDLWFNLVALALVERRAKIVAYLTIFDILESVILFVIIIKK
jgi:hypothetical protein